MSDERVAEDRLLPPPKKPTSSTGRNTASWIVTIVIAVAATRGIKTWEMQAYSIQSASRGATHDSGVEIGHGGEEAKGGRVHAPYCSMGRKNLLLFYWPKGWIRICAKIGTTQMGLSISRKKDGWGMYIPHPSSSRGIFSLGLSSFFNFFYP